MADKFSVMQEQVSETQEMVNSSLAGSVSGTEDAELLAELESCDMQAATASPMPPAPVEVPQTGSVSQAYARAGLWN